MGIRHINNITQQEKSVLKTVNESQIMYENEKYAYTLLKKHAPKMVRYDDAKRLLEIEKINGKTLRDIEITEEIVVKLAQAIQYLHSHTQDGKVFIHGDLHKDNIMYLNGEIYFVDFSCAEYALPEVDYAAIEIHVITDKKLLDLFYATLNITLNTETIRKEKVKHALNHLTWANKENFGSVYLKSKKIIEENDELIKEDDFDFLGVIQISDNLKDTRLTTQLDDKTIISRSFEYYKPKTYNELADFREYLKSLFPLNIKHAFIVCEYMLNASRRLYYEDFKKELNKEPNHLAISKKCMEEDVGNIIACLENKVIDKPKSILSKYETDIATEDRFIEGDHKMHLYKCISQVTDVNHIVCPLYSAILVGPFFKFIHNIEYTHIKFGVHGQKMKYLYDEHRLTMDKISITPNFPQNVCIFDGNVGSGLTLTILKELFAKHGINTKTGLLEISYEYMERNNDFHQLDLIDYKTYICTRHHSVTEDLVDAFEHDPKSYIKRLRRHGFHNPFLTDIELLYNRGKTICDMHNIQLEPYITYESNFVLSMDIKNKKIRYLEDYSIDEAIRIVKDYATVNVIDLDRFYGDSQSLDIIAKILKIKKARVGGGVRTKAEIQCLLDMGAEKVIIGTHATPELLAGFDPKRIIVGLDSIDRRTNTVVDIPAKIKLFEPYCSEFNYVSVKHDGKAMGGDVENAIKYSKLTPNKFNCVGGISSKEEMLKLKEHGVGCTIGRKLQDGYFE